MKIKEQMNQKEREKKMKSNSKNELVKLISICGQAPSAPPPAYPRRYGCPCRW